MDTLTYRKRKIWKKSLILFPIIILYVNKYINKIEKHNIFNTIFPYTKIIQSYFDINNEINKI